VSHVASQACLVMLSYALSVFAVPDGNNICHLIANEAREICSDHIVGEEWTESECMSSECCWEQQTNSSVPSCYRKGLQLYVLIKSSVSEKLDITNRQ